MRILGKNIILYTVIALFASGMGSFWSCSGGNGSDPQPEFQAAFNSSPYLTHKMTGMFLVITTKGQWSISITYPVGSPQGWCTVDNSSASGTGNRNVWISTTANPAEDLRTAVINITFGSQVVSKELVQYGTVIPINTKRLELPAVVDTVWLLDYVQGDFILEYAREKKHSKWVAWSLYKGCLGSSGRSNAWSFDSRIPEQYSPKHGTSAATNDFSGYDRGHMCPSGDRTKSVTMNRDTFYYSNMSPQVGVGFNQDIWENLESRLRNLVSNNDDILYICCGGTVMKDSDIDHYTSPSRMAVPKYYFKVVLRKKSSGGAFDAIGFWFENRSYGVESTVTSANTKTVRWIEQQTGFDFFYNLDKATQDAVENQNSPSAWGITQ